MFMLGRRAIGHIVAGVFGVALLAACGGSSDDASKNTPAPTDTPIVEIAPTPTPLPPTVTPVVEQSVSPLSQPESPVDQPSSPLPTPEVATEGGPSIVQLVPSDYNVISQLASETTAPPPTANMASLSAVLYSPSIIVIPGTAFYLTKAIEEGDKLIIPTLYAGPDLTKGDVAGFTNDYGQIILKDVPPGNYYLAVWTVYNWPLAFGAPDDSLPLLITLTEGQVNDLGLLYVEWP